MRGVTLEPETVGDFAAEHKIAIGTSFEEVLADPAVQAVILATPHTKHPEQVKALAAAGKHIYCEKPFALSKVEAAAMLDAVKRAGVVIGVGHHFRLMPSIRILDELMKSGAFGTIMYVEGNYSHDWLANLPADTWRMAAAESRAGGMTGMGIHVLDCFRDLNGPMKRISALSKARALKVPTGDTTAALIEFENGSTGTLGTTIKTPFRWRIAIFGENCWAESVSETRAIVRHAGKDDPEVRFRFRPPAFCRPRRRWRRCLNRWTAMAHGWRFDDGRAANQIRRRRRLREHDGRLEPLRRRRLPRLA